MSYKSNTEAWALALVPPPVKEERVLPSILIGRPSLVFTTIGSTSLPLIKVEA